MKRRPARAFFACLVGRRRTTCGSDEYLYVLSGKGTFWIGSRQTDVRSRRGISCSSSAALSTPSSRSARTRYVSLSWTSDRLSGETRPGWTAPRVRAGITSTRLHPSCALAGSLQDQLRDFIRLRDKGQVTRLHLDDLGAHPLGHEALKV